jgi:antitoxin ChpS
MLYSDIILEVAVATVKLRKVGGSTMLAIPPSILEALSVSADALLSLSVSKGKLTVTEAKPRFKLEKLLAEHEVTLSNDREWLAMPAAGREI